MEEFKVLMYHEIIKKSDFDYKAYKGIKVSQNYQDILPPVLFAYLENFEQQMKYLHDEGYNTISLRDIIDFYYKDKPLPSKPVLLTFDDMYKSVLMYAYPILKQYGFNAVGFVVKDWLFDEKQGYSVNQSVCMSLEELEQMRDVFEYANHSSSLHTRSEGKGALQSIGKEEFLEDVQECQQFVDSKDVFAYPFGIYTADNVEWLKEAGYLLAFTSIGGANNKNTNKFELNRNGVLLDHDLEHFKSIVKFNEGTGE
jgi:peptidoglycan/xylan/chitin deacetylase (PgdA/CDA1 family)